MRAKENPTNLEQKLFLLIKIKLLASDINHINFCFTEFSVMLPDKYIYP